MSKRVALAVVLVVLCAGLLAAAGKQEARPERPAAFSWQQFAGEEIRFVAVRFYYTNIIKDKLAEFEALTGMKVKLEDYPYEQFMQKMLVEMAGGSTTLDAFTTGTAYEGRKFFVSGWYEPLDQYLNDPVLTDPNWDPDDFITSVWEAQVMDGTRVAVPLNSVTWLLMYRDDLYKELGLSVPQTMSELEQNAKKLTESGGVFGFAGRGRRTQSTAAWGSHLYAFGGEWIDSNRQPAFNSAAGVQALEFYARMMQNYANPGAAENHWQDILSMMQQGTVAQMIDTNAWIGALTNPEQSKVVDKVAFAPIPAGPTGVRAADLWSWNMAVSPFSRKKEPAWLLCQWVTGKDLQKSIQLQRFPSARQSSWGSPEFAQIANKSWLESTLTSFGYAQPTAHPVVVEVHEIADLVGAAIVDTILGNQRAKQALDQAAAEVAAIMKASE